MLKLTTSSEDPQTEEEIRRSKDKLIAPEVVLLRLDKAHDRSKLVHTAKESGVKKVLVFANAINAMKLIRQVSACVYKQWI